MGSAAAKIFQKGVGQVGEGYVQGFHGPDAPQQEIGTASSIARSSQEFGPRRDQWVKMVDECMQARSVASCLFPIREKVVSKKKIVRSEISAIFWQFTHSEWVSGCLTI